MTSLSCASNWELKRELSEFSQSQPELPLFGRLDAPSVAPAKLIRYARDFREACQIAWTYRRIKGMTFAMLSAETGIYKSHITEYLSPKCKTPRDMPAKYIPAFEKQVGNTIVTQWLALQADLTISEEMQADRKAA